jgi:uncharacterized membrane protein
MFLSLRRIDVMNIKAVFNYFLIGVLAIIPIVVIIQIVWFVKGVIAGIFYLLIGFSDNYLFTGFLLLLSFSVFTYIGYRVSVVGKSWIIAGIDAIVNRIPFLNTIYRVTKKVVNLISGHEQKTDREVVYIEYPKEGLWVPAYVTNKKDEMYVLFVPTSPNPTSGFTIIVHQSRVVKSDMNIEEATSFIVSVGVDFTNADEINKLK